MKTNPAKTPPAPARPQTVAPLADVQRAASLLAQAASFLRAGAARLTGTKIGLAPRIAAGAQIALRAEPARRGRIELGDRVEVGAHALLHPWGGSIEVADDVHIGPGCVLYGHGGIRIGALTLLSPGCRIIAANHTVPAPEVPIRSQPDRPEPVQIGRDVWIGAGACILAGVSIGDGCVVGAGAVVTKDLPPNSIALGVPAQVTGSRAPAAPAAKK